ncbi:MAG TPA: DUF2207 domain-containing protein [Bacillota bacterium]|nr:DUF2207 domain-containing protein [Bacillota bacterium]
MKRSACLICLLLLFILVFSPSVAHAQDFIISGFHSDITVNEDSSFTVKEVIDVNFLRSRHGIYREIPFRYKDDLGNTVTTPLKVMSVTNGAGEKWKYQVSRKGDAVNIKIGDAKKYVSGPQTYVITYKVENAVLFFDDHDQLYWNVTGNYWQAPVKKASAEVRLAVRDTSKELKAACYTGFYGSEESQGGFEAANNSGKFYTQRELKKGEGFTIVFGWDKGLVSPPTPLKKFLWALNFRDNWVFIFPVFALIFMVNLWYKRGRDPKVRESVAVMYEPPKFNGSPLTPAEVGAIVDEKMDPRDITSTIVGLAVKGYIKIEEKKKDGLLFHSTDYYLAKVREPDAELSAFENLLMERIFSGLPGVHVSELKNKFYKNLGELKDSLYGGLVDKKYFLKNPDRVRTFYIIAGVISAALVAAAGFIFQALFNSYAAGQSFLAGILTGLTVIAFAKAMPAKTRAGASAYMDILGFQEFLNRAEKDRLERMGDKNLFSRFLPYAIALDVTDNWAKAFEGIYQEQPDWYVSPGGMRVFTPYVFIGSINSMASSAGAAMFSAPRSGGAGGAGGFGGGGFSGGGFGGGGGGSW